MPNLGELTAPAAEAAKRYDALRTKQSPAEIQSSVGLTREGYHELPGSEDMSPEELAQLDRMSQGELYGMGARLAQPGTAGAAALNTLGYAASLPGAVVGAVGNEAAKLIPGGPAVAATVAGAVGGEPTQFQVDQTTSQPSVANIAALLRGHARGVYGSKPLTQQQPVQPPVLGADEGGGL